MSKLKVLLISGIYLIAVVLMGLVWFLLPAEITTKSVLSFVFILIPVTLLFATVGYACYRSNQEVLQNNLLTVGAVAYLAIAAAVTLILGILPVNLRFYVIAQAIVMGLGIVEMIILYLAKLHIEC